MSEPDAKTYQTRHGPMMGLRGDAYVSRSLELYGEYGAEEAALFAQLIKPGMTVVEVGANIGAHTVAMARQCAPGALYAFEPQQRVFQILCANLALNDIRNVVALPEAGGAEDGFVVVPSIDYSRQGNYGGVSVQEDREGARGRRVRVTPIDSLQLAACHILKIDVEGFEPQVLRGARETIARCRPILYVENDRAEHQQEIISLIDEMGYHQYWHAPALFDPKNPNGVTENVFGNVASVNLFCLPKERETKVGGLQLIDPNNWTCPVKLHTETKSAEQHPGVTEALADIAAARYRQADERLRGLLAQEPRDNEVLHAMGAFRHLFGQEAEAEAALRAALDVSPDNARTRLALGGVLLAQGRYAEGWPLFEARHDEQGHTKPGLTFAEWRGEPLAGKRLLIWPEEGFGDQIQFARFAPWLRERGAEVGLLCHPKLYALFEGSLGVNVYQALGKVEIPDHDYWAMCNSVAGLAGVTVETLPNDPYLRAGSRATPKGARIGIVSRGNPNHANDANRSLPQAFAERLLALPGAISLLPEDTRAKTFAETAALIDGLDLVVSVDTSVAHLAGAMGKPTWILLPYIGADWRWMRGREDSPWYPSARLFRQPRPGDWESVVKAVEAAAPGALQGPAPRAGRRK